jgi:hypothetical protein
MLTGLALLGGTAYTAKSWKHASVLVTQDEGFDPSTCKGISGTKKDTAWCVASCGAITKPDCPSSFCACEGEVPYDSSLTDAATARDAEIAKRDAGIANGNSGGAVDAVVSERDASVAERGASTASDDAADDTGTVFDASTCVGVSGTEKDAAWCVASCGAPIKPDCPTNFCKCNGEAAHDSSITDVGSARDADVAKRDAEVASRGGGAAAGDVDATFDASTCKGISGTAKDTAWCVASCGAPIKPDCPSTVCACEGDVPYDSSVRATDAANARDAEVTKRDADIAKRAAGSAGAADDADAATDAGAAFDASTCKGVSGTEKDAAWCVASCGAPIKPDCPSTVCVCEGDAPYDSSVRDTDAANDRDAEIVKRDADIAKRAAGGAIATDAADVSDDGDDADASMDASSDAGTAFDASTCKGVSGTEKDAAWCVASCGAPIKPDCPSTFCTCKGEVPHDSSAGASANSDVTDAASATADTIAKRDADIASRGSANSRDSAAGESAALSDPTFDGSTCHRVQEHRADQPGNNEDDDKWCLEHCGLTPPECPALFCKCDPPTFDLPPNMQDTGDGAHVMGGLIP